MNEFAKLSSTVEELEYRVDVVTKRIKTSKSVAIDSFTGDRSMQIVCTVKGGTIEITAIFVGDVKGMVLYVDDAEAAVASGACMTALIDGLTKGYRTLRIDIATEGTVNGGLITIMGAEDII